MAYMWVKDFKAHYKLGLGFAHPELIWKDCFQFSTTYILLGFILFTFHFQKHIQFKSWGILFMLKDKENEILFLEKCTATPVEVY